MTEVATAVVEATQECQAAELKSGPGVTPNMKRQVGAQTRFVFSSLSPVFNAGDVELVTKTSSDIVWVAVPAACELGERQVRAMVQTRLENLRLRMAEVHFGRRPADTGARWLLC